MRQHQGRLLREASEAPHFPHHRLMSCLLPSTTATSEHASLHPEHGSSSLDSELLRALDILMCVIRV